MLFLVLFFNFYKQQPYAIMSLCRSVGESLCLKLIFQRILVI